MKTLTVYNISAPKNFIDVINSCRGRVMVKFDEHHLLDLNNNEIACRAIINKSQEDNKGIHLLFTDTFDFETFYRFILEAELSA